MPRAGWIALGSVTAALFLGSAASVHAPIGAMLVGAAIVLGARTLAGTQGHRSPGVRLRAIVGGFGLGVLLIAVRLTVAPGGGPAAPMALPGGDGPWTGTVVSIGAPRAGQQPLVVQLDPPAALRLAATMPPYPVLVPGDRVALRGSLRAPPADDPYGDYLARIGVAATLRAASVAVEPPSDDLGRTLEGLRRAADMALRHSIPEPEAGLASGILIGLRDRVDRDLTADFTAVGATHVVAISGWNIAIVASTLAALAGRVARRRRVALTVLAIVAYVVFVGPSASVVRAAGMAGVVMLARELGRPSRAAAAIGWAATALLLVDPRLIDDVGFRLSALATVGLIAWGTPIADRLAGPQPGRVRAWLAEILGVSLAAQLATLPIVVMTFGRLSIVSPLVNLGVVPLIAPAMAAGVVALAGGLLVLGGLPGALATVLGLPAWFLLGVVVGIVRAGASIPFASVQLEAPWDAVAAGLAGLVILVVAGRRRHAHMRPTTPAPARRVGGRGGGGDRFIAVGLAAAVIVLAVAVVQRPDGIPRIVVLDVGQGDAILVEGSRGGRLLVDGGPDPGRLLIALDEHLAPWDRRIDLVVLSHPHEDHAAGLAAVLDRYAVRRVLEPGMFGPGPGYAALNAALLEAGIERGTMATGDRLTVDDVRLQVLWPDPGSVPELPPDGGTGINNVSIVLLGEVGRHRFLLTGDIEEQIDPRLLARSLPAVDVLKVAHHGSRTSSTEDFLEAIRPSVAVISAGRANPYGHPAPATVERLQSAGARVLRTDEDGTVTVDLGPGAIGVRADGSRPQAGVRANEAPAVAWLCGLGTAAGAPAAGTASTVAPQPPTTSTQPASEQRTSALPRSGPSPRVAPPAPDPPLGYDAVRGGPEQLRARRLLLGRRRLRHRGGRRGVPGRPGALSRWGTRALAKSGRPRRRSPPAR